MANIYEYPNAIGDGTLIPDLVTNEMTCNGTATFSGDVTFADNGVAFDRIPKVVKVALAAVDTAGGVFAWANPESSAILVTRVLVDVTTEATGACTLDVGTTATSAATLSDNLIDGADIGSAAGLFSNLKNAGTNGKADQKLASGKWVTGSVASGASAGLVGSAYIEYIVV